MKSLCNFCWDPHTQALDLEPLMWSGGPHITSELVGSQSGEGPTNGGEPKLDPDTVATTLELVMKPGASQAKSRSWKQIDFELRVDYLSG